MDDLAQRTAVTEQDSRTHLAPVIGATSLVALLGLGLAYAAYIRRFVLHDIPLTGALNGRLRSFMSTIGELSYYESKSARHHSILSSHGADPPMLFLHGIDLAASSYEMKPLFEHYARERSVYALDLPGFGFSERSEQLYTPAVYRDAINQFVALELRGEPVDAVALSLSCEFLALAARQRPELFRTLTLISPTGISMVAPRPRSDRWLRLLLDPRWSRIIYDTLTSRYGLSHFLQKRQRRQVDRRTLHYAYVSSHQPMAQVAPFHYVAGKLCTPEIISVYRSLTQPVLAIYGAGRRMSFDMMDNLRSLPNWQVVEYRQSGEYVHLDEPDNVIAQMGHFLRTQTTA